MRVKVKIDSIEEDSIIFFKKVATYRIESEAEYPGTLIIVKRKLKDFEKLWEIMTENYPSQLIPPLPDSSGTKITRNSLFFYLKHHVEKPEIKAKLLTISLQCTLSHSILKEDEYFKEFLIAADINEKIPLIKNIEAPVQVRADYFSGRWMRVGGGKRMAKDQAYIKVRMN